MADVEQALYFCERVDLDLLGNVEALQAQLIFYEQGHHVSGPSEVDVLHSLALLELCPVR